MPLYERPGITAGLRHLALNVNNLSKLPEEIGELTELTEFRVYKNNLTALPESIMKLTNLTYLDISSNSKLELTSAQKEWIASLKAKGCEVRL